MERGECAYPKGMRTGWLFLLLVVQGCAVAPLSNHVTARTNGNGGSMISAGSTMAIGKRGWVPSLKYSVGLNNDFDLGFQYEVVEYGVWGKYAFINRPEEGISLAAISGLGASFEGLYGYLGPIVSWKKGKWEPYFITRFNYVSFPERKSQLVSTGEVTVLPGVYRYFQHTLGFFFWPEEWLGFGLEASYFTPLSSPFVLVNSERSIFSGNFSFRF